MPDRYDLNVERELAELERDANEITGWACDHPEQVGDLLLAMLATDSDAELASLARALCARCRTTLCDLASERASALEQEWLEVEADRRREARSAYGSLWREGRKS